MIELQGVVGVNLPGFVSITETWLSPVAPDSAVHLSNYILLRRDRPTHAGGACILLMRKFHVPVSVPLSRLKLNRYGLKLDHCVFQDRYLWFWLELSTIRLLALLFLCDQPEGLIFICGDCNPTSTCITELAVKRATGLSQIVKVNTIDSGTLDWCLTNHPKLMDCPKRLPKLGSTDHYTFLIHPLQSSSTSKNTT